MLSLTCQDILQRPLAAACRQECRWRLARQRPTRRASRKSCSFSPSVFRDIGRPPCRNNSRAQLSCAADTVPDHVTGPCTASCGPAATRINMSLHEQTPHQLVKAAVVKNVLVYHLLHSSNSLLHLVYHSAQGACRVTPTHVRQRHGSRGSGARHPHQSVEG